MVVGPIVEVLNRTPYTLHAIKDGRRYTIPPGRSHLTLDVVYFAKQQNPVPGSEDPQSLRFESLISIVAAPGQKQKDPLDLIPEDVLKALPKERIDRTKLAPDRQANLEERTVDFPKTAHVEAPTEGMRALLHTDRTGD
jgi:hypothetical protein